MLDFGDLLKKDHQDQSNTFGTQSGIRTVQFYRNEEVKALVEETFRFDGHPLPVSFGYKFKDLPSLVEENNAQLVVIDLVGCVDTLKECRQLSTRLPTHLSVIVLGDADSISIVRELKTIGFYYLYWPVDKIELAEFVDSVVTRHIETNALKSRRRAKRIGIVGMRGGIGTSLICAELGWILTNKKQTSCLVVDNNYLTGNLDIFLGLKNRDKRRLGSTETGNEIDQTSARTLVTRINSRLDYLALGLSEESSTELQEVNDLVVSHLSPETNFVLEDFSASVGFDIQPKQLLKTLDVAVIVMEPSISCLRETSAMLRKIKKLMEEPEFKRSMRVLIVLNNHRAPRFSSVTEAEIEKYLEAKIDVVLPYEVSAEEALVNGTRIGEGKSKLGAQLNVLCSRIIGEDTSGNTKKTLFSFLHRKDK
ncbi:AAA family ATPase [Grimontia hollisae]|uniref:AAA family ATPase n=1 Tax=Grimontia hollisae TaxID=673 RepID=UPI000E002254|nr:cellulose synthase operon protein YhjQ/BcsQ [Grimontia hollisae]STQ75640.1 Flp pilus assembly protein, ATPase CpaE [Grimontia hollisae]